MERVEAPTTATLEAIADAFNRHDVDAIMAFFAEDAVFEAPAGLDPWGRRLVGKDQVREGFAARFAGIPGCPLRRRLPLGQRRQRRLGMDAHGHHDRGRAARAAWL